MRQRYRTARAIKHHQRLHDAAVDSSVLPATAASLPPPAASPPPNRYLEFSAPADLPDAAAAEPADLPAAAQVHPTSPQAQVPMQPPSDDTVSASPSPPDSPLIRCSQFRQAQHDQEQAAAEERNGPSPLLEKIADWQSRCASPGSSVSGSSVSTGSSVSGGSVPSTYKGPKPPNPSIGPPMIRDAQGRRWVHKDFRNSEGLQPVCYVNTGYNREGVKKPGYFCFDAKDLMWAHRLKLHINDLGGYHY